MSSLPFAIWRYGSGAPAMQAMKALKAGAMPASGALSVVVEKSDGEWRKEGFEVDGEW